MPLQPNKALGQPSPRPVHAAILLTTSGLTAMVTAVLGPTLPKMQAHFAVAPRVALLVPLSLTVPMLVMAGLSVFAGALSDKIGRKRLLVGSTAMYAVFGTAPLYLGTLSSIVISRIGLGVAEAVLMTVSTMMIGDYYHDAQREKYMSLQTTTAATLAFAFNLLGGLLGEYGWRAPYGVYAIGAPLALFMAIYLWEPMTCAARESSRPAGADPQCRPDASGVTFKPALLAVICVLTALCGIAFLIVPIHLGYLLADVGVKSSAQIGIVYALNSVGVVLGTVSFGWLVAPRLRVSAQLVLCFAVTAGGCLMLQAATTYLLLTLAAIVNGYGTGLMLPTLVTWNMRELPFRKRGLGTGAFQSSLFLGMFLNPIVVVGLDSWLGSRAAAIGAVGTAIFAAAGFGVAIGIFKRPGRTPPNAHAHPRAPQE